MAKVDLHPDFRDFFASLNAAKAKYLLVGGHAVIWYGYLPATDDLDIRISTDKENATRISQVLQDFAGFLA